MKELIMGDPQIEALLRELRKEIDKIDEVDEASEKKLNSLINSVEKKLSNSIDAEEDEELLSRLQSTIRHLEVSHPELTETMNNIMTTLSNMGL